MVGIEETATDSVSSSPAAPARLRARIMASGYQYQMLEKRDLPCLELEEASRVRAGERSATWLKICLLLLAAVSLALLVALVSVLARQARDGAPPAVQQVCESPTCVGLSASILSKMDPDVSPCEDMYKLACGKWIRDAVLPPGQSSWISFRMVEEQSNIKLRQLVEGRGSLYKGRNSSAVLKWKTWYSSCMDVDSIEAQGTTRLQELMTELGSWTVSPPPGGAPDWAADTWSLQDTLVKSHRLAASSLFRCTVTRDATVEESKRIVACDQSGLTLGTLDFYDEDQEKLRQGFLDYSTLVASLLGGREAEARLKMEEVFQFEKNLSKIFVSSNEMSSPLKRYNKYNVSRFQDLLGELVDIEAYLRELFNGRSFNASTEIIVVTPNYFSKLEQTVTSAGKETLANYMMWNLLQKLVAYLPEAFLRAELELTRVLSGATSLPERWKHCLDTAKLAVGWAGSALFVDKYFPSSSKVKVTSALQHIRAEFIHLLDEVSWLDHVTRDQLRGKAQAMSVSIGYPDWLLSVDTLDHRYNDLEVTEGDFFLNMLNSFEFKRNRTVENLDKKPDPNDWESLPEEVNALYRPTVNMIVMLAGILQPPFFSQDYPDALLYGTVGVILGHELTHGFDNHGRLYDKTGRLQEQWTPAVERGFKNATVCMADQYAAFSAQGHQLNGNLTLGENIADNGGIKLAYRAFRSKGQPSNARLPGLNFTDSQLFYLGFSQIWCAVSTPEDEIHQIYKNPHSLPRFRVKGTLSNSPDFASAFKCPVGSQLNPKSKCTVW